MSDETNDRAAKAPATAAEWRAAVGDLVAQAQAAEAKASEIESGRGPLALRAQLGHRDAAVQLASLDAELERLARRRRDLEGAKAEAERELAAAERREAEERLARDLREAERLTRAAREVAERLDAAIEQSARDAHELERLFARAGALRGGNTTLIGERVERAVRGAFWCRGLKVGDYAQRQARVPLVEGLAAALAVGPPLRREPVAAAEASA